MRIPRRRFLRLVASAAVLPAATRGARGAGYPARRVRLVVGFAAGGTQDTVARLIGQWLSERLGQTFVIENRPGAGGNIAAETVVNAQPDGYTLLLVGFSNAVNATLYDNLGFNFIRDIAPIAGIVRLPQVLEVNPSVPARTVPEFIDYLRANPGKVTFASAGNGSPNHLAAELFKMMAQVDIVHVPYRGGSAAMADLLGGHVQAIFESIPVSGEYIKAGKVRALAVTTPRRLPALPDLPPLADLLPGYEISGLYGLGAPRNTPADIIDTLNKEINAALTDPAMKRRFDDFGAAVFPGPPAAFAKLIADETEKWGKVIRAANIRPE
ncbi:MAG TPA: tripartite tricarboxylate transporter substrate binding protein [Xanthobacteraceae bacterium]|jgi:tripartite-type tricarboxylate transporter receptor subunit TctC|nr:tripartite tricarboxylate transporter substrate binding protein [Xanthobacteraceae bacterium]